MKSIADITGGAYFRAINNSKLEDIYKEIDQLEKTKIEVTQYRKKTERFLPWAILGTALILLEFALRNTLFRSIV